MIKFHVPVWGLLWRGTALCLAAAFVMRGHIFKRRLRRGHMFKRRLRRDWTSARNAAAPAPSNACAPVDVSFDR
jgi:hypothetical protein